MREIKFRVWSKKFKQWLKPEEHVIYADNGDVGEVNDGELVEFIVHNTAVEQFTGLRDKNGKEIYEGDIVQFKPFPYQRGVVIFEGFGFNIEGFWDSSYDCPSYAFSEGNNYEVIGNIHENQELLKDKHERD